jgi:hypothetical protein
MEISKINESKKSKNFISIEDIKSFLNNENFKITIYFESIIDESTFEKDYLEENSY